MTSGTFYGNLQRYRVSPGLPPACTSSVTRPPSCGATLARASTTVAVSQALVARRATIYLRRLEGEADRGWVKVAAAIRTI
jgi:hypothetical protein